MMRPNDALHPDSGIDEMEADTCLTNTHRRMWAGTRSYNRPRVRPLVRVGKVALSDSNGNASLPRLQWGCL
jgi:hypothetical protein